MSTSIFPRQSEHLLGKVIIALLQLNLPAAFNEPRLANTYLGACAALKKGGFMAGGPTWGIFATSQGSLAICLLSCCRFEVETDGQSMDIVDVSLDKMKDDGSTEEEEEEEDDDSVYGGPVSSQAAPPLSCAALLKIPLLCQHVASQLV